MWIKRSSPIQKQAGRESKHGKEIEKQLETGNGNKLNVLSLLKSTLLAASTLSSLIYPTYPLTRLLSSPNTTLLLILALATEQLLLFGSRYLPNPAITALAIAALISELYQRHASAPELLTILSNAAINASMVLLPCRISVSERTNLFSTAILLTLLLVNFSTPGVVQTTITPLLVYFAPRVIASMKINSVVFEITRSGTLLLGVQKPGRDIMLRAERDEGEEMWFLGNLNVMIGLTGTIVGVAVAVLWTVGEGLKSFFGV